MIVQFLQRLCTAFIRRETGTLKVNVVVNLKVKKKTIAWQSQFVRRINVKKDNSGVQLRLWAGANINRFSHTEISFVKQKIHRLWHSRIAMTFTRRNTHITGEKIQRDSL